MADEPQKSGKEKGDLSDRMDELSQRIALYEKLQKQLLQIRLGAVFLLVLMLCIFIFSFYHRLTHLDLEEIQNQSVERLALATPIMGQYLTDMGQRVLPLYLEIIQAKAAEKLPIFVNQATKEAEELLLYVKEDTTKRLNDGFMSMLESQGRYILQEFPELEDEQTVLELAENVRIILARSLKNVTMEKLDAHLNAISSIQTKLNKLKEEVKRTPERNVELKLLAVTLELIGKKLTKEIYAVERGLQQ